VSSAVCQWSTLTGASTWQSYAFWLSTRASWPTRRRWRMPQPKPRKPSVSQSTSSTLKEVGHAWTHGDFSMRHRAVHMPQGRALCWGQAGEVGIV